ncbi:MAG: RNA polymerase sigma factor [Archangium sp.]
MSDDDAELMLRVSRGDRQAFAQLFDRHQQRVVRFCFRFTGDRGRAEELAQDTFVRLYRSADRYQARAKFSTFLFHIATNLCLNAQRGAKARPEAPVEQVVERADVDTPEATLSAKDTEAAVQRALQKMSDRERAAFAMARFEGLPYRDIAEALEASEAAIKSLVHRASLQVVEQLERSAS